MQKRCTKEKAFVGHVLTGTGWIFAVSTALVSVSSISEANNLDRAVLIGDAAVPAAQVAEALDQCTEHEPELKASQCLNDFWAPRWLLDREAQARDLKSKPHLAHTQADLLHVRLAEQIRENVNAPSAGEIDAYIKKHPRDFEKPQRIRIFRILVATLDQAREVIGKLKPTMTIADFRALAREHSVDRATNERGGDLGFVWPDGSTDVPQVSAEKSLYAAAAALKEGQYSTQPVPEGKRFAIIWRRGSLPAVSVSDESRELLSQRLVEKQTEEKLQELLKAHAKDVRNRDNVLLGKLRRKEASLFREPSSSAR